MADYKKVVEMLGEHLASFLELAKKMLIDWAIEPKKLLHTLHQIRKSDLVGLIEGTHEITHKRFGKLIKELKITVPTSYDHDSQIDKFAQKAEQFPANLNYSCSLEYANGDFINENHRLIPGKTYNVKFFQILGKVTSRECIEFLEKQNAIFVGAHGLALMYDVCCHEIPYEKLTVSFDEKNSLLGDSQHKVPDMFRFNDFYKFQAHPFWNDLTDNSCLLCFSLIS